ncbi:unnamed protein product, partial [Coccothraustes coccothraustes]
KICSKACSRFSYGDELVAMAIQPDVCLVCWWCVENPVFGRRPLLFPCRQAAALLLGKEHALQYNILSSNTVATVPTS